MTSKSEHSTSWRHPLIQSCLSPIHLSQSALMVPGAPPPPCQGSRFGGKVVETDSKQAKRKKKKKTQVNFKQARGRGGQVQDSPGPRAAATPSDKVSGDLRVGLLSWREGPQAGGPLSSLGLRNSGLPQTTDPQPHPSGQPMSSWGWEPEDGARGCAEKRGHPAGARRRDRLLRPLACSAVAPGRRTQPAGRWAGGSAAKQLSALPGLLLVAKAGTGAQKLKGWPRRHQWQPITGALSARSPITTRRRTPVQSHSSIWSLNQSEHEI